MPSHPHFLKLGKKLAGFREQKRVIALSQLTVSAIVAGEEESMGEEKMSAEEFDTCFGCLGVVAFGFLIAISLLSIILTASYPGNTGKDQIIYDQQRDMIVADLSFIPWLANRVKDGEEKRYYFIPERKEIVGISANVSFKAKLVMPRTNEAVKKFALRQAKGTADEDLFKALQDCVASVIKIPNRIEGYPDISARAWSISNMNFHCPIAAEFGYQWEENLEIGQCFVNEVKDPWQKENCLNLVRTR